MNTAERIHQQEQSNHFAAPHSSFDINSKTVLTLDEFVAYTGIKKSYAYKLTSTRAIKHSKPSGKVIFFARADVDAFLLSNPIKTRIEIDEEARSASGRRVR
jgi:excisionase family DNA binding protein